MPQGMYSASRSWTGSGVPSITLPLSFLPFLCELSIPHCTEGAHSVLASSIWIAQCLVHLVWRWEEVSEFKIFLCYCFPRGQVNLFIKKEYKVDLDCITHIIYSQMWRNISYNFLLLFVFCLWLYTSLFFIQFPYIIHSFIYSVNILKYLVCLIHSWDHRI